MFDVVDEGKLDGEHDTLGFVLVDKEVVDEEEEEEEEEDEDKDEEDSGDEDDEMGEHRWIGEFSLTLLSKSVSNEQRSLGMDIVE